MKAFISYHRKFSTWPAITVQRYLLERGVDVFLDMESISSGRFENVILNEIRERDHFILIVAEGTLLRLNESGDWVARELAHALEAQKNVIPILLDGVRITDLAKDFSHRGQLLELNCLSMPAEYSSEALDRLYDTYLCNPTIQARRAFLAEEHWERAMKAVEEKDWRVVESEIKSALKYSQRPEYYYLLASSVHAQGRMQEAIKVIDSAISLDPFGYELMETKFYWLQELDQMQEAIRWYSDRGWKAEAKAAARRFGDFLLQQVREGKSLREAVDSIQQLSCVHRDQTEGRRQLAILQDIISFAPEEIANDLRECLRSDDLYVYRDQ